MDSFAPSLCNYGFHPHLFASCSTFALSLFPYIMTPSFTLPCPLSLLLCTPKNPLPLLYVMISDQHFPLTSRLSQLSSLLPDMKYDPIRQSWCAFYKVSYLLCCSGSLPFILCTSFLY